MSTAEILNVRLSRRNLLKTAFLVPSAFILLSSCAEPVRSPHALTSPIPVPTEIPHIAPELEKLGQEIRQWRLQDGRLMTDLFTEVLLAADLLQGNLDPKTVLPSFKEPFTLSIDLKINIGGLLLDEKLDKNDPRKVGIYSKGQLVYIDNWLMSTTAKLQLNPDIQSSDARFYIAVKELTQLVYRIQYQKLYRSLLEQGATQFIIKDPTNAILSEQEKASRFGTTISRFERDKYGYSSLDDFIDVGTRLQTAPIGAYPET